MSAGDDPINVVFRRVSGSQGGQEHKNDADSAYERFAELGQGRIQAEHSAEYLADQSELYEQLQPANLPKISTTRLSR